MSEKPLPAIPEPGPLQEALVEAIMDHGLRDGAADYQAIASAMVIILADLIGPQARDLRKIMFRDFADNLASAVQVRAASELLSRSELSSKPN